MLVNDPIQGILFDAKETVLFTNIRQPKARKAMRMVIKVRDMQKTATQRRKTRLHKTPTPYLLDADDSNMSITELLNSMDKKRRIRK